MKNTLVWTPTFTRTARRFLRRHPDVRGEFETVLRHLEDNPNHPSLRLHPLQGNHRGKHAVSLTYSYRIVLVLVLVLKEAEVVLLDVGTQDDVYRP